MNTHINRQIILCQGAEAPRWERALFSENGAGKAEYPHAKEWRWTLTSHHTENDSKSIKDINVRHKTPGRKQGKSFMTLDLSVISGA